MEDKKDIKKLFDKILGDKIILKDNFKVDDEAVFCLLVNKLDEIVDTVELAGNVGKTGATTYFQGVKRMPEREDFHKLWKVMSEKEYEMIFKSSKI